MIFRSLTADIDLDRRIEADDGMMARPTQVADTMAVTWGVIYIDLDARLCRRQRYRVVGSRLSKRPFGVMKEPMHYYYRRR